MSMTRKRQLMVIVIILVAMSLSACQGASPGIGGSSDMKITVLVDGESYVYTYGKPISVGQFLREVGIVMGPDDDVNPLPQTQLRDNLRVTITRVRYEEECEYPVLPYDEERQPNQGLAPGEERIIQFGRDGKLEVCYRITYQDGLQWGDPVQISSVVFEEPVKQIIAVGRERPNTFIAIDGVLTYISSGQAWVVEGVASSQRPLTAEGYLDGQVFMLSDDGQRILFTRLSDDETDPDFSNELWAIMDISARGVPQPVDLGLIDVRVANWVPGKRTPTVSYSTFTPRPSARGYDALNDLYLMELDPVTGDILEGPDSVIPTNSWGKYPFWGRRLKWSPDGSQLAWANADSVGVVDFEAEDDDRFVPLVSFAEFRPLLEQLQAAAGWIPTLSWSADGHLITTVHGAPYGEEQPEDSIVFDLAVIDTSNAFTIDKFFSQTGIWSVPTYSPPSDGPNGDQVYSIAYFKARDPLRSPGADYDLWIADQDGSNARRLFPDPNLPGLRPDPENGIVWSPSGRQIALIHQGDLWIIDAGTGQATQITNDGHASRPQWSG